MFRTLIVPLDGSEAAERALPYAARLAAASGGRLALIRVVPDSALNVSQLEEHQQAALSEVESYLAAAADRVTSGVPVPVVLSTVWGDPATKLLESVQEMSADAVVMATHGRTGLAHVLHGSVAEALLARSPVPVLLVHARAGEAASLPFDPGSARILVPLDGSAFAEAAIPLAVQLLGTAGELVLVTVAAPPDHPLRDERGQVRAYLDQQEDGLERDAREYLRQVAAKIERSDLDLHVALDVRLGDPAAGIVMAEIDRGADLVVMSTHGRTGLRRSVMGSVAGEVLRTGSAPVMLVGPVGVRSAGELSDQLLARAMSDR